MVARARDSQRSKVYAWEVTATRSADAGVIEWPDVLALVNRVMVDYGREAPEVTDGRGARWARGSRTRIKLPRWARTRPVILHECAHSLLGPGYVHGPEFVRLYIDLCSRYLGLSIRELRASARAAKVKVGTSAACPKPIDREERRLIRELREAREAVKAAIKREDNVIGAIAKYRRGKR